MHLYTKAYGMHRDIDPHALPKLVETMVSEAKGAIVVAVIDDSEEGEHVMLCQELWFQYGDSFRYFQHH